MCKVSPHPSRPATLSFGIITLLITALSLANGNATTPFDGVTADEHATTCGEVKTLPGNTDSTTEVLPIVTIVTTPCTCFHCGQNIMVACSGTPLIFGLPPATDNCTSSLTVTQIGGPPSGSIFPDCPQILTFQATDGSGNAAICTRLVVVVGVPVVAIDQIIDDNNGAGIGAISVSVGCIGPVTYKWTGPNGFTASTEDISDLFGGTYILIVTNAAGCSTTLTIAVQNLVAINDPARGEEGAVHILPNPATDGIRLIVTDDVELLSGKIIDTQGRLLQTISENDLTTEISIRKLTPGLYFLYLLTGNNTWTAMKFVKAE